MTKKINNKDAQLTSVSVSEQKLSSFRHSLIEWFRQNGRDLPWRQTKDPYKIWLSEVILQQTQVIQGWDYYIKFIQKYPEVKDLAAASEDEVLLMWQGLGYYSRALNLHHAAKQIVEQYGGNFPREEKDVAGLKGVGPYTTAAIMSIAYDYPLAVVDGNVYRVLSRVGAYVMPIDTYTGQRFYRSLAQLYLDKDAPSIYNQAIMDLGAMICTPRQPQCDKCPVARYCDSSSNIELTSLLPIKSKRTKVTQLYMDYFLLIKNDHFYVQERDKRGIWKGLYELPLVEQSQRNMTESEVLQCLCNGCQLIESITLPPHRLTHRLINITIHVCEVVGEEGLDDYQIQPIYRHHQIAFPKPLRSFLNRYFKRSNKY